MGVDALAEDPKLVADAVADRRQFQAGQRFLETGGQAPQASVAQARFRFAGDQLLQVEAEFAAGVLRLIADAEVH